MERLLLFDIDGTLVDVGGAGREALRTALLAVYGDTGRIDEFDFHGRTDPSIVRDLLREAGHSEDRIEAGFDLLWEAYYAALERELARPGSDPARGSDSAAGADRARGPVPSRGSAPGPGPPPPPPARRARVHPGVRDLLDRIAADGRFAPGLVTGNMEMGARHKLRACGLGGYFGFGAFGSDSEHRDELPPLARRRAEAVHGLAFRLDEAVVIGDTPHDIRCGRACGARVIAVATGRHREPELRAHGPDLVLRDLGDVDAVLEAIDRG